MKILRYILFVVVFSAIAFFAKAEAPFGPGVRVGMELTDPGGGRDIYGLGAGFFAGVVYRLPLSWSVHLEPGVMFFYSTMSSKKDINVNGYYYQDAARNMGLRIPLMVGYTFSFSDKFDMGLATGPMLNINLYARQNILPNFNAPVPVPDRRINLFDQGWKRVDAQWGFKLSFVFVKSYYIGLTGGVSFTPLASYGMKDKKIRVQRNTIAISLGYNF